MLKLSTKARTMSALQQDIISFLHDRITMHQEIRNSTIKAARRAAIAERIDELSTVADLLGTLQFKRKVK